MEPVRRVAERVRDGFCAWLVLTAVVVVLHLAGGAFESDIGGYEDAPAHLVTALMIHDFVAAGDLGDPMGYAEDYYLHLPKVSFGQWPPVLHTTLAGWMLVFGDSRVSVITYLSAITGLLGAVIFLAVRRDLGHVLAATSALICVAVPLVQDLGGSVMTELPLTLFCTLAVFSFGRFLDTQSWRHAVLFGVWSVIAILTKGSGLALAMVPLASVALSGRWQLLRRPELWGAAGIVGACAAPWYLWTIKISAASWSGGHLPTWEYFVSAARLYGAELFALGGVVMVAAAAVGAWSCIADRALRARWSAPIAWVPSMLLFHGLVPSSIEARHLVLVVPVLVALAAVGVARVVPLAIAAGRQRAWVAALVLVVAFGIGAFAVVAKDVRGYGSAADTLFRELADEPVVLIVSDALGEGAFVAEMALRDEPRPNRMVLRASKLLADSDWLGHDVEPRFATAEQVHAFLESVPVGVIVFDGATQPHQWYEHHDQINAVLARYADQWRVVARDAVVRRGEAAGEIVIYQLRRARKGEVVRPDVGRMLQRRVPRR